MNDLLSPHVQDWWKQSFVQGAGLTGRAWPFGRPVFIFGKTPPKHAAEPRDLPHADLEPPQRVEIETTHTSCTNFCVDQSCAYTRSEGPPTLCDA